MGSLRGFGSALVAFFFFAVSAVAGSALEEREWANDKGQTFRGEMVGFRTEGGWEYVSVRRSDGRFFEISLEDLSPADQEYARGQSARFAAVSSSAAPPPALTSFEKSAREHLVVFNGKRFEDWESESRPEFYALYFSAGWCGPCRRFTPDLVDFYDRYHDRYGNFEVIFVSSDRSEEDMAGYMEDAEMPWPAVEFSRKQRARSLTRHAERGIPNLVVVDRDGKVLAKSYVDGNYVGPREVLDELKDLVRDKG